MKRSFEGFASLKSFLENWASWSEAGYDFGGIVALFRACLSNISANAIQGDWESLSERLTDDDKRTLEKIMDAARASVEE